MIKAVLTDRQTDISCVRLVALILIICCHLTQYYDLEVCQWLNVGVQVFLCISGFLYGQKRITDYSTFLNKRFWKILLPYYLVFLTYALIIWRFHREQFDYQRFWGGLIISKTLNGAGHLWFIPTILMCYTITVFLDIYNKRYIKTNRSWLVFFTVTSIITEIAFRNFLYYYGAAWMVCYVMAYSLGINDKRGFFSTKWIVVIFLFMAVLGNALQIYIDYIGSVSIPETFSTYYSRFKSYNHVWLGISIFLSIRCIWKRIQVGERIKNLFLITDKYSYEAYLVHQLIILGPLSLMRITNIVPFNIVVIISLICFFAWVLYEVETFLQKLITARGINHVS